MLLDFAETVSFVLTQARFMDTDPFSMTYFTGLDASHLTEMNLDTL
jgi:hypothetical protein